MDVLCSIDSPALNNTNHITTGTPIWRNQQAVQTTWQSFHEDQIVDLCANNEPPIIQDDVASMETSHNLFV